MADRPFLTVRALAEMMQLPLYEQVRILSEQKYPREAPQRFRIPYYSPGLVAIRNYYRSANDQGVLEEARDQIRLTVKNQARRNHNLRPTER